MLSAKFYADIMLNSMMSTHLRESCGTELVTLVRSRIPPEQWRLCELDRQKEHSWVTGEHERVSQGQSGPSATL